MPVCPSDMTDAQWAVVRDVMPVPAWLGAGAGSRRLLPPRDAGCDLLRDRQRQWRSMPADFPAWDRVHAFFRRWRERGLVKEFHDRLRGRPREAEGRKAEPTAAIIDSQSVKGAASVPAALAGL
ncbi:transposase [Streptomyces sp. NPDC001315]|uniref:transposase n=1 Tax=Streptomyces sp. NPDC001315 TaxID=3364562 RepID=UPI0036A5D4FF